MKKFCVLLIFVMTLSLLPALAFAEGAYAKTDVDLGEPLSPDHKGWFKLSTCTPPSETPEGVVVSFTYNITENEKVNPLKEGNVYSNCVIETPRNTPEGRQMYRFVYSDVMVRQSKENFFNDTGTVELLAGSVKLYSYPMDPPETGDSASPLLWAMLLAAGACCGARVLLQKRRRARKG